MQVLRYVKDIDQERMPEEILLSLRGQLEILDENYGSNRDIYKDLGGYAVIIETLQDIKEINDRIIRGITPEDVEEIKCGDGQVYCSSLFILSSDYAVIVVATKELTEMLLENLEE